MSGREVVLIDVASRRITLDDGNVLSFDRLVLATEAKARGLFSVEGMEGIFTLCNLDDARYLRAAAAEARSALVIGGGYIGLEIAASLMKAGKKVTIVEAVARLLARVASLPVSTFFKARHGDAGVNVITGQSLAKIRSQNGKFVGASLKGGRQIDTDILIFGIRVTPNTHLAQQADLVTANGIVTDTHMQTSQSDIYAIGDCSCDGSARPGLRIESVHNARQHAERAAAAIMDSDLPRHQTPWFWSDQYDVELQSVGVLPSDGRVLNYIQREGRRTGGFSVWSFDDANLIAVEAVGDPAGFMVGKTCLEHGKSPTPEKVADPDFDLKAFVADKPVAPTTSSLAHSSELSVQGARSCIMLGA